MSAGAEATVSAGDAAPAPASSKGVCSVRHGLALLLHLCNFAISTQQMNLSIALPAMVNGTAPAGAPNASSAVALDDGNGTLMEPKVLAPVYAWSPEIQGVLLSSLSYGSFVASVPSGYVAGRVRPRLLIGASLLAFSALSLLIPLAAGAGVALLILLRIVQGVAQAMVQTSQYLIWVKWAPPLEMNQLIAISISGLMLGSLTVLLVGGFLCETLGWPYVFYIFGGIGLACSCLWFPLAHDDPAAHPLISAAERDYIARSLAQQDCEPDQSLPITAMVRSLPLWSVLLSQFTEHWFFHVLMAYLPTYLHSVLRVDLQASGFLSALLLGVAFISIILGGLLADCLLSRNVLSLLVVRRLFTSVGVLFPSLFSVLLPWVSFSLGISMAFLALSLATSSLCQSGALVNFMDIAPRYTGFIKGLSLVFVQLSGVIAPTVSGFFLSQDAELGWRNIFLLSAAVDVSGLVFFLVFSRAEVQDWARAQTLTRL
ncbi:probable small intestine urate exporter isoform X1 [Pipistrellus kuhlii]|uniref:Solute carrier family 17 member 4 n=1 Tax=Pipistrellus kuhlii TaxID=59472 RepID=A0A7J7TWK5_PIPKU|nr:probable small intestine urate exporter isoform X1 [Pipistrellus kuhlii]KAF6304987.1 solute carrier family 17 member 4 [Pipistrellus kuhlii]